MNIGEIWLIYTTISWGISGLVLGIIPQTFWFRSLPSFKREGLSKESLLFAILISGIILPLCCWVILPLAIIIGIPYAAGRGFIIIIQKITKQKE